MLFFFIVTLCPATFFFCFIVTTLLILYIGTQYIEVSASNDRAIERSQIDEEIKTLRESIRSLGKDTDIEVLEEFVRVLRTKRNTLAPISCLPPEILCEIFTFTARVIHTRAFDPRWIGSMTHVCQHWRDVALACPSLWVYIFMDRRRWLEELLKRSKTTPLIVDLHIPFASSPEVWEAVHSVMGHARRFRELRVTAKTSDIMKIFPIIAPIDTPFLETLCLSNVTSYPLGMKHIYSFAGIFDTTSLRRLELNNCNICWVSSRLSGLTHLTLHDYQDIFPTLSELLDTLEKVPNLETLCVNDSMAMRRTGNATLRRVVSLPRLSLFCSTYGVSECALVLNHLSYPSTAHLRLDFFRGGMTNANISCLFAALSKVRENEICQEPIRYLKIDWGTPHFSLRAWTASCVYTPLSDDPPLDVKLRWSVPSDTSDMKTRIASQFCRTLPWTHLDTLNIGCLNLDATEWLEIFGGLAGLKTIHVRGRTACGIVDVLNKRVNKSPAHFPGLKILILGWVSFYKGASDLRHFGLKKPHLQHLDKDQLCTCLMQRRASSVGIEELHLSYCYHINDVDVDLLSRTVGRVEWDGINQTPRMHPQAYDLI